MAKIKFVSKQDLLFKTFLARQTEVLEAAKENRDMVIVDRLGGMSDDDLMKLGERFVQVFVHWDSAPKAEHMDGWIIREVRGY